MIDLVIHSLRSLIHLIQPVLVPLCFVGAWLFVMLMGWTTWTTTRDTVDKAKRMHQIPCSNCQFFTGNYVLKCPVHPTEALSEDAINCIDFEAKPST